MLLLAAYRLAGFLNAPVRTFATSAARTSPGAFMSGMGMEARHLDHRLFIACVVKGTSREPVSGTT